MKADHLVLLMARAEFAREQLDIAISRGASHRVLDVLVANRLAALAEHQRLVPSAPGAFVPPADRHVPHARKARPTKPAA